MQHIEIRVRIPADRESVWEQLADHRGWVEWSGAREVVVRQPGDPPPDGVGAIRVVRTAGLAVEEEVIAFEPPQRLAYRIAGGLPVRRHRAQIDLVPAGGETDLCWHVEFDAALPGSGRALRWLLERATRGMAEGLAARFRAGEPAKVAQA